MRTTQTEATNSIEQEIASAIQTLENILVIAQDTARTSPTSEAVFDTLAHNIRTLIDSLKSEDF
jgi:hypothetical protein